MARTAVVASLARRAPAVPAAASACSSSSGSPPPSRCRSRRRRRARVVASQALRVRHPVAAARAAQPHRVRVGGRAVGVGAGRSRRSRAGGARPARRRPGAPRAPLPAGRRPARRLVLPRRGRRPADRRARSRQGRLPASCTPQRCEVVVVGTGTPDLDPSLGLVVVGRAVRTDPLLLAGTFDPGHDVPLLLADGVANVQSLASLSFFQRSYGWVAPLDFDLVRRLGVDAYLARSAAASDQLSRVLRRDAADRAGQHVACAGRPSPAVVEPVRAARRVGNRAAARVLRDRRDRAATGPARRSTRCCADVARAPAPYGCSARSRRRSRCCWGRCWASRSGSGSERSSPPRPTCRRRARRGPACAPRCPGSPSARCSRRSWSP